MDDITSIHQARKTILEMIHDRGYEVPISYNYDKISDFKQIFNKKQYDIHILGDKQIYVKFILVTKVRPNILREYINQIREQHISDTNDLIIVIKHKPNSTLKKISKEFKGVQIFWIRNLIINITKHKLNPIFEEINGDQINELLLKLQLKTRYQLPIMLKEDPISLYYGFKPGSVCKIIRKSVTSGECTSYRCIK